MVESNCVAARLNINEIQTNLKCNGRINKKKILVIIKLNSGNIWCLGKVMIITIGHIEIEDRHFLIPVIRA